MEEQVIEVGRSLMMKGFAGEERDFELMRQGQTASQQV